MSMSTDDPKSSVLKDEPVIGVVLARGGSKGLPGKNIRPLGGHPLIAWSIAAARASRLIDEVILSTDDEAIARVGLQYGASVPFRRPAALAGDHSTDLEVFDHVLGWLKAQGRRPSMLVQLRPTCPARPPGLIDQAIERFTAYPDADSLRVITPAPLPPYKMWTLPDGPDSPMQPLLTLEGVAEPYNMPRQSLPPVYWHNGLLDIIRPHVIEAGSMSGRVILPLIVEGRVSVDIDEADDFERAGRVLREGGFTIPVPVSHPLPLNW